MKKLKADLDVEDLRMLKSLAFTAGEGFKVAQEREPDMPSEIKEFGNKLLNLHSKLEGLISQIDDFESKEEVKEDKPIVIDNKATA